MASFGLSKAFTAKGLYYFAGTEPFTHFRRVSSPAPEIAKSPGEGAPHSLRLVAKDYYVKTYGEKSFILC